MSNIDSISLSFIFNLSLKSFCKTTHEYYDEYLKEEFTEYIEDFL